MSWLIPQMVPPTEHPRRHRSSPTIHAIDNEFISGFIEAAPDGIVMVDTTGVIVLVNRQAEKLFGYGRAEFVGMPVEDLLPVQMRHAHRAHRIRYLAKPRTRPMGLGLTLVGRRNDGSEFPVEISLSHIDAGDERRIIATVRDITDRRIADQLLQEATSNVRLLEDRERIARDLHDLVIQRLFAAGMALQAVMSRSADDEVADRVTRVIDDLDDTIRQLRSVIFGLHEHRRNSLRAEVARVLAEESFALGFEPQVRFDGPVDTLGGELAEHLLLTLREALSNVARHAAATSAVVEVMATATSLTLRVIDDGIGILPERASGEGLPNVRARARELGGDCCVSVRTPTGTVLEWWAPIG